MASIVRTTSPSILDGLSLLGRRLVGLLGDKEYKITPFGQEALTCEAVEKITGLSQARIGKAMFVNADGQSIIALIAGNSRLNIKALKTCLEAKKAYLPVSKDVCSATGLVIGAVTPLITLERPDICVVLDKSLCDFECINISSGDPSFGININPILLADLIHARLGNIQS